MRKTGKKILPVILSLVMVFSMSTFAFADGPGVNTLTAYTGQTGIGNYSISTAAQLAELANMVNSGTTYAGSTFILTEDINLEDDSTYGDLSWDGETDWTPIGGQCGEDRSYVPDGNSFQGIFSGYNGNNVHTISNMTIAASGVSSSDQAGYGLFGYVNGGSIGNLNVSGTIHISGNAEYVGGIVGYSSGNIYNCDSSVNISAASSSNVGGIAGAIERKSEGNIVVKYCKNTGSVNGGKRVGGIAGGVYSVNSGISSIEYCGNEGAVSASGSGKVYTGGIAGYLRGNVKYSYNSANVTSAARYIGGIAGLVNGYSAPYGKIMYSYSAANSVTGENASYCKPLYATADSNARATITNVFYLGSGNFTQPTSSTWGTCTNVQSVTASQLNGTELVSDSATIVDMLNVGTENNAGFLIKENNARPYLNCLGENGFIVADRSLLTSTATGVSENSDDSDMIFLDPINGTDNTNGDLDHPVGTLTAAMSLATNSRNVIYVVNTINITEGTVSVTSPVVNETTVPVIIKRSCLNHGYIFNVTGGTLNLQNVTIDGNRSDIASGSLVNVDGGTFKVAGATLQNCFANAGGAIRLVSGSASIESGTFSNNNSIAHDCGIFVYGSDLAITPNGTINLNDKIYLADGHAIDCQSQSLSGVSHNITIESECVNDMSLVVKDVLTQNDANKFEYYLNDYSLIYDSSRNRVYISNEESTVSDNSATDGNPELLLDGEFPTRTITESCTYPDGSVIAGIQTIKGGTEENPIVITIEGTVRASSDSSITTLSHLFYPRSGYVIFKGKDNAVIDTSTAGRKTMNAIRLRSTAGSTDPVNVVVDNVTLDGSNNSDSLIFVHMNTTSGTLKLCNGTTLRNNSINDQYTAPGIGGRDCVNVILDGVKFENIRNTNETPNSEGIDFSPVDIYSADFDYTTHASSIYSNSEDTLTNIMPTGKIKIGGISTGGIKLTPQEGSTITSYNLVQSDGTTVTEIPTEETDLGKTLTSLEINTSKSGEPTYSAYLSNVSGTEIAKNGTFTADVYVKSDSPIAAAQIDLNVQNGKITGIEPAADGIETENGKISVFNNQADVSEGYKLATVTVEADGSQNDVVLSIENTSSVGIAGLVEDYSFTLGDDAQATVSIYKTDKVSCEEYVAGKYLVKYTGDVSDGSVAQYNGEEMLYSEKLGGWIAVVDEDVSESLINNDVTTAAGTKKSVDYTGDVNLSGRVNIVDAQIAYDISSNVHTDYSIATKPMWYRADVNGDGKVLAADARAIQCIVHGITA